MKFSLSTIYPKSMNCVRIFILCLALLAPALAGAGGEAEDDFGEEFSFEVEEFEKKSLEWGGFAELKWEHLDINQGSAFATLNLPHNQSTLDRGRGSLQLDGSYSREIFSLHWLLKGYMQKDNLDFEHKADAYQAYASFKPSPMLSASLGKKSYKWGKGYAWNPVGFINRPKDPNDPEEAMEGFITGELDLIKSFSGPLQTVALTTVLLPVRSDINEDFGEPDHLNMAAKLYLLYRDTDIDFIAYTGNSRSSRFGVDFARNLAPNFEIHGELAYIPSLKKTLLKDNGQVQVENLQATSWLLGLRYLSESNITSIIEYYGNDAGLSLDQAELFYELTEQARSGDSAALQKAKQLAQKGYGKPQPGKNYMYLRFTQKEPFDILYFTPGLTSIINIEDGSFSLAPEMTYTGLENWELRLRFSWLQGGKNTEYGEKINSNKLEFRVRYFF